VGLAVVKTWKKHDGTGQAGEAIPEMGMEWCSRFQMTEEQHVIGTDMIERETTLEIVNADALSLLCHATDPENGGIAEIYILGSVGRAGKRRSLVDLTRVCMCLSHYVIVV